MAGGSAKRDQRPGALRRALGRAKIRSTASCKQPRPARHGLALHRLRRARARAGSNSWSTSGHGTRLQAIRLVREHGVRAIAVDPVPLHVELAREAVAEAGLDVEKSSKQGSRPCRVDDDERGLDLVPRRPRARRRRARLRRVRADPASRRADARLRHLREPTRSSRGKRTELFDALAIVRESTDPRSARATPQQTPARPWSRKTELGGEWRERMIEDGSWDPGDDLLRLSRLHRIAGRSSSSRYGETRVAAYAAARMWGIYQLLGKLCSDRSTSGDAMRSVARAVAARPRRQHPARRAASCGRRTRSTRSSRDRTRPARSRIASPRR